ncbi:Protein Wnt-8b [Exaiptasia diaphana]|nr:Protein Wnt-8b [Exaiptasia diaphana]
MAKHFLEAIEIKDAPTERIKLISHNNDVGRKAVRVNLRKQCRCHGITGTCSTKTCWRRLPSFNEIGKYLHEKYKKAKKVRYIKRLFKTKGPKGLKSILRKEQTLIYTDSSPDYCQRNASVAADGVLGRECQGSDKNLERCRKICNSCGLKAVDYKEIQNFNCHCKFQWCCKVKCGLCKKSVCKTKCVVSNSAKIKL